MRVRSGFHNVSPGRIISMSAAGTLTPAFCEHRDDLMKFNALKYFPYRES